MVAKVNDGKKSTRLDWVLSTVVLVAILLPAIIVGFFEAYVRLNNEVQVKVQNEAEALINVLQEGLNPPLWAYIPENAQDLLDGISLNPSVVEVKVIDSIGDLFVSYRQKEYSNLANDIFLKADVIRDNSIVGTVELRYSTTPARTEIIDAIKRLVFVTTTQLIFSIIVIIIALQLRVTRPLQSLKNFASDIAKKQFDTDIPKVYNDEFGQLATELDLMKGALKESFENLEDRVEERTLNLLKVNKELNHAIEKLENTRNSLVQSEKLAALGALVAGVAHELNTPIGNGLLMASSLQETTNYLTKLYRDGTLTKSEFEKVVSDVHSASDLIERNLIKASDLVQSFKNVAVDRTSDKRRQFSLNAFIHEIDSTMHHIFKSKPIKMKLSLDDEVTLDSFPGVLSQVISNLLNNAVIHGFDGISRPGLVKLSTQLDDNKVQIVISDDGHGMSDEVKSKIFEPFFTTKLGRGGSGLGMHIVHNLVTGILGGQISIDSELGNGSRICLDIPLVAPETLASNAQA